MIDHAVDAPPRGELAGSPLPIEVFTEICAGPVAREAMDTLLRAENAERKQLLLAFVQEMHRNGRGEVPLADFDQAWQLLLRVEDEAPELVADVIMFPAVGLWLRRAVERLSHDFADNAANRAEIGVVHAVAAAAAVRAGLPFTIRVPVAHGVVSLPTVGRFDLPVTDAVDFVQVARTASGTTLSLAGSTLATWDGDAFRAARRHRAAAAGVRLDVVFDDADPHRAFADAPTVPDPLTDAEFERWCHQLDDAWSVLVDWHPGYASELSAGLLSLVPLTREGRLVGASSAAAFGAIALSEKPSADDLADALVHELQHSKLNAVLELVSLHEADERRHFYAPWREDPRPLNGVLHGIYAFASVVEFWHARRRHVPEHRAAEADFVFALRALQVRSAIEDVAGTARLNEWGRLFLATVSRRLAACEVDLTPAHRAGAVAGIVADHRAFWRVRHVEPDAAGIAALADAWLAERPPPGLPVRREVAHHQAPGCSDRAALLKARALEPGRAPDTPDADAADLAYVMGDVDRAATAYRERLHADPADDQAWAGLALSLDSAVLRHEPEVVRALHHEVLARTGVRSDPVRLSGWLAEARS
ncbi:HEXXH motif-containing protein [Saccharothrix tamanrassetensis]|uniref:HEXXH motif-containing protein n=1 Tax=Saccharothrix tamanrassetensis TaxID=1051531 RepID=A0A841CQG3_9PSEU|nr:HEXXH motif-containing putative peptide modification protein [Saccharothrix tamanrassetensis]MBB5959529.1 HEXXH motif-containing protein [Saccharothrix tamanrassetensis]